jgi:hypothetical protein
MSVILFDPSEVYEEMADAYAGLKYRLHADADAEARFSKALRRIYYANVATFLCQYHDDTPLSDDELQAISTFQTLTPNPAVGRDCTDVELAHHFLAAWSLLNYNLMTNDGECYQARDSIAFLDALAMRIARDVLATEVETAAAA